MLVHTLFDLISAACSMSATLLAYYWRLAPAAKRIESAGPAYALAVVGGAAAGGYGLGSLNLWLSGEAAVARSILGALAGAIATVEIFKHRRRIQGSTGLIFIPAFSTTVVVGRWGCYFAGLEDRTYGIATSLPWGKDFGDGVLRHPVQLYESFTMLLFLLCATWLLLRRSSWFMRNGFYAMVMVYAAQRFAWEFLKPYGSVLGPFNLFHLVCAALVAYACWMMRVKHERTSA